MTWHALADDFPVPVVEGLGRYQEGAKRLSSMSPAVS